MRILKTAVDRMTLHKTLTNKNVFPYDRHKYGTKTSKTRHKERELPADSEPEMRGRN